MAGVVLRLVSSDWQYARAANDNNTARARPRLGWITPVHSLPLITMADYTADSG
jgi:hypothetical protein